MLVAALLLSTSPLTSPVHLPAPRIHPEVLHYGGKTPRVFVEIEQKVQYDGDWAPPAGREPDPEPDAMVPVKRQMPWVKDIPVIVKPAPLFVDEQPPKDKSAASAEGKSSEEINAQVEELMATRDAKTKTEKETSGDPVDVGSDGTPPIALPPPGQAKGAGSVTGSKATVTYSTTPGY